MEALLASNQNITISTNDSNTVPTIDTASASSTSTGVEGKTISFNLKNADTIDGSPKKKIKINGEVFNFITFATALHSHNGKLPLPISIHTELPHIQIMLGHPDSRFNPCILGILDTGATLMVGYSDYVLGICDMYPELVSSIIWAEEKYMPISLSGVNEDASAVRNNNSAPLLLSICHTLPKTTIRLHLVSRLVRKLLLMI